MSRSIWAAAGAMFAFTLTPGAALAAGGGSSAARPASADVKHDTHVRRHPSATRRRQHLAARAAGERRVVMLLAPGSGYQQATGSGRVRALQRRLAGLGFAPGPIDGRYGPLTTQAVERFQAARGLTVDGIVGVHTLATLSATPSGALFAGAGYQQAAGSGRVRSLQRRLAGLGFAPGPIDGRYGPLTTQAVERLQGARGLMVDGIVGVHTLAVLSRGGRSLTASERVQAHRAVRGRRVSLDRRVPRGGRAPSGHRVPRGGLAPLGHRVPHTAPASARRERKSSPALPLTPVLLVLAALGLVTMLLSYAGIRAARARRAREFAGSRAGGEWDAAESPSGRSNSSGSGSEEPSAVSIASAEPTQSSAARDAVECDSPEATAATGTAELAYRRADERGEAGGAYNLGTILHERGDFAGAVSAYQRAEQRGDPNAGFNLGVLLYEAGDLEGAEIAWRRCVDGGNAKAAANLGYLLQRRGDPEGARAAYAAAARLSDAGGARTPALPDRAPDAAEASAITRAADPPRSDHRRPRGNLRGGGHDGSGS